MLIEKDLNYDTPSITVYNNQKQAVRLLKYCRSKVDKATEHRITLQRYNTAGYLKYSVDARLSAHYLQNPNSTISNQSQVNTLSGAVLQSKNVDAGMREHFGCARTYLMEQR